MKSKKEPDLNIWNDVSSRYRNSEGSVKIAVVGKYTKLEDAYKSLSEALIHGGLANKTNVEVSQSNSSNDITFTQEIVLALKRQILKNSMRNQIALKITKFIIIPSGLKIRKLKLEVKSKIKEGQ